MERYSCQPEKGKQVLACLLLFIGLLMPMIPVVPHHHHSDGLFCMKDDVTQTCCKHHHAGDGVQTAPSHCCCDTGCVTTHFFQRIVTEDTRWVSQEVSDVILFLTATLLLQTDSLPDNIDSHPLGLYRERMHGTYLTRAAGLRAPPYLLA